MKFTAVAVLAFASAAFAQTPNDVPECARGCIQDSTTKVTGCGKDDYKCACQDDNHKKIQSDSAPCVVKACGADTEKVIKAVDALCAAQ
ncbi:hypothetical protein PWT90_07548 [Aphanocladium album]|nr:hypothetical protein PWT90_07548 [Aphanocladium album]